MANNMDKKFIENLLFQYSQKTKPLLKSYLKQKIKAASEVGDINTKLLESFSKLVEKGKKIRGMLVVLGYKIAGGKDMESIYDASTLIEILHSGALIHDDIMDKDDYRRGMPTIHKQFENYGVDNGKSLAMLVGDMAFYMSWDKLLHSNFSQDKIIKAGKIYIKHALNTNYGQALDLVNNLKNNFDLDNILKVFRFKTAEYTGVAPLLIGAALGGLDDKKKLAALEEYGLDLGWAFQIQDDILGLYGKTKKTGKPIGTDLREGKLTLLVYYVIKNCKKSELDYLQSILGNKNLSEKDIIKAQEFFKMVGAYKYVTNLGWDYVAKGKKAASLLTEDKKLEKLLESLIIFVMNRVV